VISMRRKQPKHWRVPPRIRKILLVILCVMAAVFVLVNATLWIVYRNRTYPRTQLLGSVIGSTPYDQLSQKVSELKLLPAALQLTYNDQKTTVPLADLGIHKDVARTTAQANQQRSWLPILNLLSTPALKAPVAIDSDVFAAKAKELSGIFYLEPADAYLTLVNANVGIAESKDGYTLDQTKLRQALLNTLDKDSSKVRVPVKQTQPKVKVVDLKDDQRTLQEQLAVSITYTYNGKTRQASREDMAKWFIPTGGIYSVSADNLRSYIIQVGSGFGIRVKDIDQAVAAVTQAVASRKPTEVILAAQIVAKTYTYCIAAKGVDNAHLSGLRTRLQSTYADSRGWSLGGQVEFKETASGCNFTVWLSSADLMPTFGAICDSMWSCRVGPNVVINFSRWENASPSWNAAGGTLEEYRHMVINHETGHWLGFGHAQCSGPGQAAPVMQQQSINLQGCVFNAWPSTGEQGTLRRNLGLS
ncbi:MAG: DUF3152 domain-containing protein, partial [Patescibacteria group bacterium]